MKKIACEMCGSYELIKKDGVFVCEFCGMKYSLEDAKRMFIDGTVNVEGTVKVDNSAFVEKYLANARRAYDKEDWEEVEKYYNMVEQNAPNSMEAVFFSAYGKAMLSLTDSDYFKREQKFKVLSNSISVINDYFEVTTEDKEAVLTRIVAAVRKMNVVTFVINTNASSGVGSKRWQTELMNRIIMGVKTELDQIAEKHSDAYIKELKERLPPVADTNTGCCYVATAVYGSYDCPEVWTLRRFRDDQLSKTWAGRAFVTVYYAISPTLVKWFGETKWFKKMWRGTLDRMVSKLQRRGFESTPYHDKPWK